MLVAAQNPCPCGNRGSTVRACVCSLGAIYSYQKKISGPILDRIDLFVDVPPVEYDHLFSSEQNERSATVRARVERARLLQRERFVGIHIFMNSEMDSHHIESMCPLDEKTRSFLRTAAQQLRLSARSYSRIVKLARSIADLGGNERIEKNHIAEALQYRPQDVSQCI